MSDEGKKNELIMKRFGRYLLLDHLVDGGMAKICRARFLGEQADKIVAIKMVQPQFSQDEAFKKMFLTEIKVTFGLIHPNIAQTYDYGLQDDQLYTAMEYVDGKNLKEYLDKLRQRKCVFPIGISVHIAAQVCQALHYSHTLTDKLTGQQVPIIHRDISPHNVMITYDGITKVIDFGIAKSKKNEEATQAGTIKGKLSYLAPEYLEGQELDCRYDEFATGITLWEMLCGRKLFRADNDLAILKQIQACKVPPPSSINPKVPKDLDNIVLKALSRNRNDRFENMDKFNRELVKFLYSNYPSFNSSDLSYFSKELFREEIEYDRTKMLDFGKVDIRSYIEELKRDGAGGQSLNPGGPRKTFELLNLADTDHMPTLDTANNDKNAVMSYTKEDASLLVDIAGLSGASKPVELSKASSQTPTASLGSMSTQGKKSSLLDRDVTRLGAPRKKKTGGLSSLVAVAAGLAVVFYMGKDFLMTSSVRTPASATQNKEAAQKKVILRLDNYNKSYHTVYINGIKELPSFVGEVMVPLGEIFVRVERPGYEHFVRNINMVEAFTRVPIMNTNPQDFGLLMMDSNCAIGKLTFNLFGEARIEKLPIAHPGIAFPARKTNTVYYNKEGESIQRKIEFNIPGKDNVINLCQLLKLR